MRGQSPPRTPSPGRAHSRKGSARHVDPQQHGESSFLPDGTPVASNRLSADVHPRISHDLSLNDHTRDSVVDNMLLSLDQLPTGPGAFSNPIPPYASFDEDEFYPYEEQPPAARPNRLRGHTYSSSNPSEYDLRPIPTTSTYTPHHTRQSNSSSHLPTTQNDIQAGKSQDRRALHSRGGQKKGSKGSASSSMDYGQKQSLAPRSGVVHRSASFDMSGKQPSHRPPPLNLSPDVMARGRPVPVTYHSFEAAPSPTVHSGPPRFFGDGSVTNPGYPPQPLYAPPQIPSSRRNSIRSATSRSGKKPKSNYPDTAVLNQANDFYNAAIAPRDGAYENFPEGSAPSPGVALLNKQALDATNQPSPKEKEKPGFFRRVFGGSSKKENVVPAPSTPQNTTPMATNTADTPVKPPQPTGRPASKTLSKPPPSDLHKSSTTQPAGPPPPTLQKKHSSFFRRRKKSVAEPIPPPLMPLQLQTAKYGDVETGQPSPGAGSLYKAMPYLKNDESGTHKDLNTNSDDYHPGFSPEYNPHQDAVVRTVKPGSRGTENSKPSSRGKSAMSMDPLDTDSPKLKLKVKRGKVVPQSSHDTFLADSSGAEDRMNSVEACTARNSSSLGFTHDKRPKTSPTAATHPIFPPAGSDKDLPHTRANSGEKRTKRSDLQHLDVDKPRSASSSGTSNRNMSRAAPGKRIWIEPNSSDEKLNGSQIVSSPTEETRSQLTSAGRHSVSSIGEPLRSASLPIVQIDSRRTVVEPSSEDRELVSKIYHGDEEEISKARATAWLGESSERASLLRGAYMELYDWHGHSILYALRDLCSRLVLKAETQQVDRVLASFAQRWWECNPNNGFKSTDVVHGITYSILLLNTDLHMADIESKMTRAQFVKNTMPTMRRLAEEPNQELDGPATIRPSKTDPSQSSQRGFVPWVHNPDGSAARPRSGRATPSDQGDDRPSLETKRSRNRLSIRPSTFRAESDDSPAASTDNCTVLVKAPYEGSLKGWELQLEIVLKEFYNSIRSRRLPLHGAPTHPSESQEQLSNNGLSVNNTLRRTPSVLSKATSDNVSYRGRQTDYNKAATSRYHSKNRSRPRFYPSSTVGSSRTSLDDTSVWSPAQSSTWSKYSLGKTQASMMSVDSLGSHLGGADYQQSIGFANALSQAIIREEGHAIVSHEEFTRVAPLLEDESLELAGAPWAKEGILKHKHHLETVDKKAKDRGWNECFAVIEKGYMRLFSFGTSSKSTRNKSKSKASGGVVGGGNWAENAESMGSFLLRQTIANALPPPGYSKSRPHVWALSLPTGAVHLFQVGTQEIVKEFVSTANYWSARLSKEPLVGGVSNIEYGWSENVINTALVRPDSAATNHNGSVSLPRPSMQSSIRSSLEYQGSVRPRLPGDKVAIYDWSPPVSSMMASNLMEVDQLRALQAYVKNIEDELARHNELRPPMLIAFSPRHPNAGKALSNWEKKSSYLLREIVKFRTYIEALAYSENAKSKLYAQRDNEKRERQEEDPLSAMSVEVEGVDGVDEVVRSLIT